MSIQSPEHALITGFALGTLMAGSVDVAPEMDGDGNYTDRLTLRLSEVAENRTVYLRVELA